MLRLIILLVVTGNSLHGGDQDEEINKIARDNLLAGSLEPDQLAGVDPNYLVFSHGDMGEVSLVLYAAQKQKWKLVEKFIESDFIIKVNTSAAGGSEMGRSLAWYLAEHKQDKLLATLIEKYILDIDLNLNVKLYQNEFKTIFASMLDNKLSNSLRTAIKLAPSSKMPIDYNGETSKGPNLLLLAKYQEDLLKMVIEKFPNLDVNAHDLNYSVFSYAVNHHNWEAVAVMLARAQPNVLFPATRLYIKDYKSSSLLYAVDKGHWASVEAMIKRIPADAYEMTESWRDYEILKILAKKDKWELLLELLPKKHSLLFPNAPSAIQDKKEQLLFSLLFPRTIFTAVEGHSYNEFTLQKADPALVETLASIDACHRATLGNDNEEELCESLKQKANLRNIPNAVLKKLLNAFAFASNRNNGYKIAEELYTAYEARRPTLKAGGLNYICRSKDDCQRKTVDIFIDNLMKGGRFTIFNEAIKEELVVKLLRIDALDFDAVPIANVFNEVFNN